VVLEQDLVTVVVQHEVPHRLFVVDVPKQRAKHTLALSLPLCVFLEEVRPVIQQISYFFVVSLVDTLTVLCKVDGYRLQCRKLEAGLLHGSVYAQLITKR